MALGIHLGPALLLSLVLAAAPRSPGPVRTEQTPDPVVVPAGPSSACEAAPPSSAWVFPARPASGTARILLAQPDPSLDFRILRVEPDPDLHARIVVIDPEELAARQAGRTTRRDR